jgi:chromosome segregation ATPase
MTDLFGADAETQAPGSSRGGSATGRGGGRAATSAREAELMSTIANMKAALEKGTASTTPTTKYMQEVNKRKEYRKSSDLAHAELEKAKGLLAAAGRQIPELQSINADLRRQIRAAQAGDANAQMESVLVSHANEIRSLQHALATRDAELDAALRTGGLALCFFLFMLLIMYY